MLKPVYRIAKLLPLLAAAASAGCLGGPEGAAEGAENVIAEVQLSATKRIVFVDAGEGRVGVAELSSMDEAPIVTTMIRYERATPLEIFLATARAGEEAPEVLVENHREIALQQGREDLTPRRSDALRVSLEALDWPRKGTTSCDEDGWEGPSGIWGDPVDSWDNIFWAPNTQAWSNNTTYPRSQSITQLAMWNGGWGSYHTHGACLASDSGADDEISFGVTLDNNPVYSTPLDELPGDNYVTYTDYYDTGDVTESSITNVGNAAATFRHSVAAWVPNPG